MDNDIEVLKGQMDISDFLGTRVVFKEDVTNLNPSFVVGAEFDLAGETETNYIIKLGNKIYKPFKERCKKVI